MVKCTECGAEIKVPEDALKGEVIDCPDCGVELEVTDPVTKELKLADVEGEDWGQ